MLKNVTLQDVPSEFVHDVEYLARTFGCGKKRSVEIAASVLRQLIEMHEVAPDLDVILDLPRTQSGREATVTLSATPLIRRVRNRWKRRA